MRVLLFILSFLIISPALAQDASGDRVEQLEQDVMLLKRQMERARMSGGGGPPPVADAGDSPVGAAQINVKISTLEEEVRMLRGQLEEKGFENQRLSEEFEKFKRDTEFRLGEIEKTNPAAAAAPVGTAPATPPSTPAPVDNPAAAPLTDKPGAQATPIPKKKMELSVKEAPAEGAPAANAPPPGDTPRDHYNYAFRLLNQNQYDEAAKSFAEFTKKYPKDPLVGNAYYWQGETYYIRKDYAAASDNFRQGFEAMPKGPKAADNLLKLGMSLGAMKKDKEACVVLSQVAAKFKASAANVAAKAEAEHKRLGCV